MATFGLTKTTTENLQINTSTILDIITGTFQEGAKGEMILLGGLDSVYVVIGPGNAYKSTILQFLTMTALDRMYVGTLKKIEKPIINLYDTETNVKFDRVQDRLNKTENLPKDMIYNYDKGMFRVLTKADCSANEWVVDFNKFNKEREKEKKVTYTAFTDKYSGEQYKALFPIMHLTDSMSEFEPEGAMDMLTKSKNGEEGTETYYLKGGLFKSKFIGTLPTITRRTNSYFGYVAHTGENKNIGGNKYNRPEKQNQYLKGDMEIKGVSGKNNYLTLLSLFAHTATALKNPTTKMPEFPRSSAPDDYETDLNLVKMTILRSKSGPSGTTIEYVVSQSEGVKVELTNYFYTKVRENNFGVSGSNLSFWMDLYPDVKLRKSTIRELAEEDKRLGKAIEFTAFLRAMMKYQPGFKHLYDTPENIYKNIVDQRYDMNTLLESRSWWTIDQYTDEVPPYLSIFDLLEVAKGLKIPYWLEDDKVTVKKKWRKHFSKYNQDNKEADKKAE